MGNKIKRTEHAAFNKYLHLGGTALSVQLNTVLLKGISS